MAVLEDSRMVFIVSMKLLLNDPRGLDIKLISKTSLRLKILSLSHWGLTNGGPSNKQVSFLNQGLKFGSLSV